MEEEIMTFKVGDKVEHILSKDYLLVIGLGKEQILCRKKDLTEVYLFEWELRKVN